MTIDVHDLTDPARDVEVVQLLDECAVDEEQDELDCAAPANNDHSNTSHLTGGQCIKRSVLS